MKIHPKLPNPTKSQDPDWKEFSDYLKANSISEQKQPAIDAYQNASSGNYVSAEKLNHCLTLLCYGNQSHYAALSCDQLGNLDDLEYKQSLSELDQLFSSNGCNFANSSIVYKGISSACYYEVLKLNRCHQGDKITFPGFLSTTVCREKAESFMSSENPILIEITNIEKVKAIIPVNKKVLNAPSSDIPEQEVLLNRKLTFEVISNQCNTNGITVLKVKPC